MRIAVLTPSSTTHPMLGYDFYLALQAAIGYHQFDVEWLSASIGFGTDEADMRSKAEDLLLNKQADLLVVFADYPKVSCLFPLLEAVNKEMLLVNMGAKLPEDWTLQPRVTHLHMQEALFASLTGQLAYEEGGKQGVLTTNNYDGGYATVQMLVDGYMQEGGEIVFNQVQLSKPSDFSLDELATVLGEADRNTAVLCSYSNPLTALFWRDWASLQQSSVCLFGSSTFLMESIEQHKDSLIKSGTSGFMAWHAGLDNAQNRQFVSQFEQHFGRNPSCFAALGWDAGLLLLQAIQHSDAHKLSLKSKAMWHKPTIALTRGEALWDASNQTIIAPAYQLRVADSKFEWQEVGAAQILNNWKEFKKNYSQPSQHGWYNTYLCS